MGPPPLAAEGPPCLYFLSLFHIIINKASCYQIAKLLMVVDLPRPLLSAPITAVTDVPGTGFGGGPSTVEI
jgi:hypothetical protein